MVVRSHPPGLLQSGHHPAPKARLGGQGLPLPMAQATFGDIGDETETWSAGQAAAPWATDAARVPLTPIPTPYPSPYPGAPVLAIGQHPCPPSLGSPQLLLPCPGWSVPVAEWGGQILGCLLHVAHAHPYHGPSVLKRTPSHDLPSRAPEHTGPLLPSAAPSCSLFPPPPPSLLSQCWVMGMKDRDRGLGH